MEMTTARRTQRDAQRMLEEARENMLYSLPFFGTLALELDLVKDTTIQGTCTDGEKIKFNPELIEGMPFETRQYVIAHEVVHCALLHHVRRGKRNKMLWNKSCDIVTDRLLMDSGFTLPPELSENLPLILEFGDKTAEEVYALLRTDEEDDDEGGDSPSDADENSDGEGSGDGSKSDSVGPAGQSEGTRPSDTVGGVDDASENGDESDITEARRDWEGKVSKAAQVAKRMGKGSVGMDIVLDQIKKINEIDWKKELRDFVERTAKGDYTWSQPNRRYLTTCGVYLPALFSRECGKIVIAIDTSGSIGAKEFEAFEAECNAILNEFPAHVVIMYADARVCGIDEFQPGEPLKFKPRGGGGTNFCDVFVQQEKLHPDAECIIYFTDCYGRFPEGSAVPTLWLATEDHKPGSGWYPPFGKTIVMKLADNYD